MYSSNTIPDTPSSEVILETIWQYMRTYATSIRVCDSIEHSEQPYTQLVTYLIRTNHPLILHRFHKQQEQYKHFLDTFYQPDVVSLLSGRVKKYLQTVDLIHTATETFCSVPIDQESVLKYLEILPDHTALQVERKIIGKLGQLTVGKLEALVILQRQVGINGE